MAIPTVRLAALTVLLVAASAIAADPDLFTGGAGGYHTYRIPALLVTKKGTILAFCEARKTSGSDRGDIDLVLRRSKNNGRTWSRMTVVHEEGATAPITIGNPAPVEDRKTGIIHPLFTRDNQRAFATQSRDEGRTWSTPVELTEPLRAFGFAWTRLGTGPGHAIQLRNGRLLVPVWLNDRIKENYRSAALYSDDGGRSWKAGGIVPPTIQGANECMFFERPDGSVVVNFRSRERRRSMSVSKDGGLTWSEPVAIDALPDPVCQASILALPAHGKTEPRIAFANLDSAEKRVNLTLRISPDGGETWPVKRVLHAGPAGYSDLALTKDGTVLCLYENGDTRYTERLRVARIPLTALQP